MLDRGELFSNTVYIFKQFILAAFKTYVAIQGKSDGFILTLGNRCQPTQSSFGREMTISNNYGSDGYRYLQKKEIFLFPMISNLFLYSNPWPSTFDLKIDMCREMCCV